MQLAMETTPATTPPSQNTAGRIVRNVLVLGFGQMFTWASTFALVLVLPNALGARDLGRLATAVAVSDFASLIAVLGVTGYVTKETARRGEHADLLNALATRIPLVMAACIAAVASSWALGVDPATRDAIYVLCIGIAMSGFAAVLAGGLQGAQDMRSYAIATTLQKIALIGMVTLFVWSGFGLMGVAWAWTLQNVVLTVACLIPLMRRGLLGGTINARAWKIVLVGSAPFFLWQASLLFYGQIDVLILSALASSDVVGWYSAAYRIIAIPVFVPVIIVSAIFPALAKTAIDDPRRVLPLARRSAQFIMIATMPLAIGIAMVAPAIVDVLGYPDEFSNSVPLIIILALHVPLMGIDMVLGALLTATDRQRAWAFTGLAAACFNPLVNLALIPYFDRVHGNAAIGAATTTVLTECLMFVVGMVLLRGSLFDRATRSVAARCGAATVVMAAAVWIAQDIPLAATIVVGGGVYAAAALTLGVVRLNDVRALGGYITDRAANRAAASV